MLSDREKIILHIVASMTIARMTGVHKKDQIIDKMIQDVRRERCRSIAPEDLEHILEEINEEMLAGKIMFQQLTGDLQWMKTGERPNKNTNWKDMR